MEPVVKVGGPAIPLDRRDVDTDQIIPARHLKRIERTGYGEFAFEAWKKSPDFVLNDAAYEGASIMITRDNFGSGSSREHAVWALTGLGIRALVGTSFADIFKGNAFQSGLLAVELPEGDVDHLMATAQASPGTHFEVDLESQSVSIPNSGWTREFEIDPYRKYRLLRGLDDISMTIEYEADIARFESTRPQFLPTTS